MDNVFAKYQNEVFPYRYEGILVVSDLHGGVPVSPKIVEGWIRTKMELKEDQIQRLVLQTMADRGVNMEEAIEGTAKEMSANGFKRDDNGLYIEGRQLKAALKEASNVAWGGIRKFGTGVAQKGPRSFFAEHVFVVEDRLYLGTNEATREEESFVHTFRGSSIKREEVVDDAKIPFTVVTDRELSKKEWATLWLTAGQGGIGASRSQGHGQFYVGKWDQVS